MAYELNRLTSVRSTPAKDADSLASLGGGVVMFGTGKTFRDAVGQDWINVLIPPGVLEGWVLESSCKIVDDPAPLPLDPEAFVRQCTLVDRVLNNDAAIAPWLVTADFVIARSLFETGMAVKQFKVGEGHTGPLRLLQVEWDAFLSSGLNVAKEFQATDVAYSMVQVYAAAYRMHTDGKAISAGMAGGAGAADGPYVPSYLDLFHSYLADPAAAVLISQNQGNSAVLLSAVVSAAHFAGITGRPQFTGVKSSTTVQQFTDLTERILAEALDAAFSKIKTFAADELPESSAGSAPWFNVAQAELGANVSVAATPDRIKGYFAATDFGPVVGDIPNWCGAFAAHCVKQSGFASSIPSGAAVAAHWKSWGTRNVPVGASDVPVGAIVVLTPSPGTNTSGHMGFIALK